jgi:hypothetical protein
VSIPEPVSFIMTITSCVLLLFIRCLLPSDNYNRSQMGRTIPSFRIASVMEKEKWESFHKALDKKDRKIVDNMFDISILYNSASVYSTKYVRMHPIFMSIIFHHYKQLVEITEQVIK